MKTIQDWIEIFNRDPECLRLIEKAVCLTERSNQELPVHANMYWRQNIFEAKQRKPLSCVYTLNAAILGGTQRLS